MKELAKAFSVLSPKAKRRMVILLPVLLLGMALETLSIGMVIPALGIIIQDSYFEKFPGLISFLNHFGNLSHERLIAAGLVLMAATFTLKNVYLFFQVLLQGTFVYSAQREIALHLFHKYLQRNYSFHLKINSSVLIRNLTTEVNSFCSYFLMPALNLLSELLVVLAILCFILWIEPAGTICLGLTLGILAMLFFKSTNKLVGSWGKQRLAAEEQKIRYLQQGFGGIKEIILCGRIPYFLQKYNVPNRISGLMFKREYIFQYLPKQGVEVLAVLGLTGMCLYLLSIERSSLEIMHMLGLMATAGFRLIPSFSRILTNLQAIRFGWASVDALSKEFSESIMPHQPKTQEVDPKLLNAEQFNKILLKDLSFSYERTPVLNGLNLEICKGQSIGIVGESGSGKSTFANIILGLLTPSSGSISVDNLEINPQNIGLWQRMVGYVPQDVFLLDDTLRRNIAFGMLDEEIDEDRVLKVLEMAKLESFIDDETKGLNLILGERGVRLSGGQKQRIGIARALYHDPEILVLDEATSALDNHTEAEILKTLKPLIGQTTLITIAHRTSSTSICETCYSMEKGVLIKPENS